MEESSQEVGKHRIYFFQRKLVVNAKLQLILLFHAFAVGYCAIALVQFKLSLDDSPLAEDLWFGISVHHFFVFLITISAFCILALINLFLTNQIAGPIHRLTDHMDRLIRGENPMPISFRKRDQFRELAEKYNELLAKRLNDEKQKAP